MLQTPNGIREGIPSVNNQLYPVTLSPPQIKGLHQKKRVIRKFSDLLHWKNVWTDSSAWSLPLLPVLLVDTFDLWKSYINLESIEHIQSPPICNNGRCNWGASILLLRSQCILSVKCWGNIFKFNPSYSVVSSHLLTLRAQLDETKTFLSAASCFHSVASQLPLGTPGRLSKHLHILCFPLATHLVPNGLSRCMLFWVAAFEKETLPSGDVLLHVLPIVECWLCTVILKGSKSSKVLCWMGLVHIDTTGVVSSEIPWNLIGILFKLQARQTLWFSARKNMGEKLRIGIS